MEQSVVISWIGEERVHAVPHLPHLTAELVQVSSSWPRSPGST